MSSEKNPVVYQKKALEFVNKPVLLDDALRVVSTKHWLSLLIIIIVIAAFTIWLIWGKIFIQVNGQGMLMSISNNVITVQASEQGGIVKKILIKPGQKVEKNTLLVEFDSDLETQFNLQAIYLKKLKEQQTELAKRAKLNISKIEQNQQEQIVKINASLEAAQQKLIQLEKMLELKEAALKKGILDLPNVTETRIEYYRLLQEIRSHEAQLIAMKATFEDLSEKWQERQRELEMNINKAEYDYQLAKIRWQQTNKITSPSTGIVAEIRIKEGDYIKSGEPLLTIIPQNNDLYALVFIPAAKGKLVKAGMAVQVVPSIINKLEFGGIKGYVESVSLLPISNENMMTFFKDRELVQFFQSGTPLIAVTVKLEKNPSTPTGYQWTSSKGPLIGLTQGTVVESMINVEMKRPIELLINFAH